MDQTSRLIIALAEQCRRLIAASEMHDPSLPDALQPKHLVWMCDQIVEHADTSPPTRLHRWIGFIQCAMLANRMINAAGVSAMLDTAKAAIGTADQELEDLTDHLDPTDSFELDIGGEA